MEEESSSSGEMDSRRRFQKVKQRLKGRFHVKTKRRKTVSVKCSDLRAKNNLSLSRSRLGAGSHGACPSPSAHHLVRNLRSQNVALASSLNERLMENTELSNMVHALRDENMALNLEIAELRHAQTAEPAQAVDPVWLELEHVKRLAEYMEPVKGLMNRVLDHTVSMSEELSQAMALVSAPGRRSRSMHAQRATHSSASSGPGPFNGSRVPSLPSEAISSSRSSSNGANIAHVSPRVAGYAIHKPQIEIQRLDMDEINRLQAEQRERSRSRRSGSEDASAEGAEEHEEEPLAPAQHTPDTPPSDESERVNRRPSRSRMAISRMSTIGEGSDEEEQPADRTTPESRRPSVSNATPRRVQRRQSVSIARRLSSSFRTSGSPVVLLENVSELLDQYNLQNLPASDESGSDENENQDYLNDTENSGDDDDHDDDDDLPQDSQQKCHGPDSSRKDEVVLLMPTCRLVLERVKLSERRRSSKSSESASRLSTCSPGSIKKRNSNVTPNILSGITTQRGKKASSEKNWRNSTRTCEADSSSTMIDVPADAESTRLEPRSPVVSGVRDSLQSEQSETPLTSESLEEFTARMCNMDPMEGPSWLFTDDDEITPGRRSREVVARKKWSSVSLRAQIGDCSKKLELDSDDGNVEVKDPPVSKRPQQNGAMSVQPYKSRKRTVHWKPSLDGASLEQDASESNQEFIAPSPLASQKSPESVPKRKSIRQSRVKKPKLNTHDEQPVTVSDQPIPANTNKTSPKAKIPTRSPSRASSSSSSSHSIPSTPNAPSENGSVYSTPCAAVGGDEEAGEVSRPRRRAATAASNSLKEPSLNKKMRQGDPHSESVYSNFVPKVKEKVAKSKSKK